MAQQPDPRSNKNNPRNGAPDPNFNWRGLILFALAVFLIGGFYLTNGRTAGLTEVPQSKFFELLEKDQVVSDAQHPVELIRDQGAGTEYLKGCYRPNPAGPPAPF